jgi:flagellar motor switch protein FliG
MGTAVAAVPTSMVPLSTGKTARGADISASLSGAQKAAVLCMALGADEAVKLTQMLTPEEAEEITFHIAQMDHVSASTVESVLNEWLDMALAVDSVAVGGLAYATELLEKAFGPAKAKATLKRIQSQLADSAGLHRLRNVDPQQLATTLRGEHPQTIALILAHLDPPQTAVILKDLDPELGAEVMYRIGCMEKVAPEMMQLIERALSNETDLSFTNGLRAAGGPDAVASVLNHVSGSLEKDLLDRIHERDPQLCEQIKNLMFVFEDIGRLDDRSLQRVIREVEVRVLALALKNVREELKTRIMGAMSQRAVTALKDEMAMLGAVRLRDVEAAQAQIVAQVRALEAADEITIGIGAEDEFIE